MSKNIVVASYKTGQYIGRAEDERNNMVLIEVLAVIKHPWQGDLHNPKQANVPFFQERRALSYGERAWMPVHTIVEYKEESIPEYKKSLNDALNKYKIELTENNNDWSKRSLHCLEQVEKDYNLD
ncbi:sporulation phosphorelay system protein KapB [Bacillus sp. NEB1478]|uniref:sporulation phosphorelay system protein KapB n=1 Tax=Bacillus sp. NEB1478 TaxID=3073816 RepID=UPI002872BFB5|nr:sporulation phosphorelay system protein KapB [Bacillus sp. NEB1478]WNB90207.1 sporulation phosphorelay system protein KapB [Bacillus sp. NEB1478]